MENGNVKNIITIGASAGGIAAVAKLLEGFKKGFDAAIFIVLHMARNSMSEIILKQLQKQTALACRIPVDGEEIVNGNVYLAPANHHLLVEKGNVIVREGALENHWRPSIDVLFRSAAAAYSSCVIGIILTGLLDDGTSGMSAIKRSGGICMVQDPNEAEFPDMPRNVLRNMKVDYTVSINEMSYILADLFSRTSCEPTEVPADIKLEASISKRMSSNVHELLELGPLTPFTCPDCGGTLVKVENDDVPRYRCYTGHTFTEKILENEQIKAVEESLWVAIRLMEERKNLLSTMKTHDLVMKNEKADRMTLHIERLKKMLTDLNKGNE